jgi:hypothetical protein
MSLGSATPRLGDALEQKHLSLSVITRGDLSLGAFVRRVGSHSNDDENSTLPA